MSDVVDKAVGLEIGRNRLSAFAEVSPTVSGSHRVAETHGAVHMALCSIAAGPRWSAQASLR